MFKKFVEWWTRPVELPNWVWIIMMSVCFVDIVDAILRLIKKA